MKILQLIYSLESGGAERFTIDLSNELSKKNEVLLCTIFDDKIPSKNFYKNLLSNSVNFNSLKSQKGISFRALIKFIYQVYIYKPDVIHVHLNTVFYAIIVSFFYRKCKYIHTIHNVAEVDVGKHLEKRIKTFFYKRRIFIPVTISPECKESFIKFLKINNVFQINNGCSLPVKSDNYKSVENEINSFKKDVSDKIFIHIARFHEHKNQQMLINVFNKLDQDGFDYVLLIIGAGFDSFDGKKLTSASNSKIHFLGEKTNVKDYIFFSDVFVLTSNYEGLPISLLEAISCGTFAICTPAGGIPYVLRDNQIGYISTDFSEQNYYNLLIKYLCSNETIDKSKISSYFRANFSIESCASEYEKVYRSVDK